MPLVEIDPEFRRTHILGVLFCIGLLLIMWLLSLLGPDEYIWQSQPGVRYTMMILVGGLVLFGLISIAWIARSRGGVIVRGAEGGLVVFPPIWALKRQFIPMTHAEREFASITVVNSKTGATLRNFGPMPPAQSWTLVIETPERVWRVNLRGVLVKSGYRDRFDTWRLEHA